MLPDRYVMKAPRGLHGSELFLHEMSVMGTENAVMAASLASGSIPRSEALRTASRGVLPPWIMLATFGAGQR